MTHTVEHQERTLEVEYCGVVTSVPPGETLIVGREGDIEVDDNPFLHRHFLAFAEAQGMWFVSNVGSQLSATVADADGQMEAFLAPGASLPLVFGTTLVAFTAGPTTYELEVRSPTASYSPPPVRDDVTHGDTTIGPTRLTPDQHLLIVALAEPRLRGDGRASVVLPSSTVAAKRLGWTLKRFNRKLDNVCEKLDRLGVRGLRGDIAEYASNRRARLVEYAVATRLVTASDLELLDALLEPPERAG